MTKPAARALDLCTGHKGFPPRPATGGSPNVFINSRPAHRVGDTWAVHCSKGSCHPSVLATGSPTVLTNGRPQGRVSDTVACTSKVATGSMNVLVGDTGFVSSPAPSPPIPTNPSSIMPLQANVMAVSSTFSSLPTKLESLVNYEPSQGWMYGSFNFNALDRSLYEFLNFVETRDSEIHSKLQSAGGFDAGSKGELSFIYAWEDLSENERFRILQEEFVNYFTLLYLKGKLEKQGIILSEKFNDLLREIVSSLGKDNQIVETALRDLKDSLDDEDRIANAIVDEWSSRLPNGSLKYYPGLSVVEQIKMINKIKQFGQKITG